ncbi:MAG TPA: FAD-binding oxidoreductase [Candidatus Limnocylindrales bacterium]|nr:FAD-binding oxidoreductase [Candidatus Limnocylindrales bacterium]
MTTTTSALQDQLQRLRAEISGRVIEPADPDYDTLRSVMYGGVDRHPAAVVRVANVDDVRAVIAFARETGAQLAIRSGGHSAKGDSTTEGGIVLDLRELRAIDIDVDARTGWFETGLTAADVSQAAAAHGLAIGFGDTGSVGIGGITTGGGIGYLVRKHGMTIDNVLAADVVTADGQLLRADASTNPDLFWAIRGGGGNFGVVVRVQYRLVELPGIVGGMLFLPATAETVERFIALAGEAPEELSTIANVMPCPPMPMVDAAWHGKLVIFGLMCYAGPAEEGANALQPFRDLAKLAGLDAPIADLVKPMTYPEMFPPEDPDYHPLAVSLNLMLDRVDRGTAETIMSFLESSDASLRAAQIRVLGGAMARVPVDATAYAHRASPIMVNIAVFYTDEEDRKRRLAWATDFFNAIRQGDEGAYVGFVGDEGEARIHAAYPGATYQHLAEVKRRYDPTNLFRLNQNIPPA